MTPTANRVTPEDIITLQPNQVFVFGSNEAGNHGRGAAAFARHWGARRSIAAGRAGQTYAIPTKPANVRLRLCLRDISKYVDDFIDHARTHTKDYFLVTAIGCGLVGYTARDIAPLFRAAAALENVALPASFWAVLADG